MGLGVGDERGRVGEVAHLGFEPGGGDRGEEPLEGGLLGGVGGVARLVGAGQVAPGADDLDRAGRAVLRGGLGEDRPLVLGDAAARDPGVPFEVDAGGRPGAVGGGCHGREARERGDAEFGAGPDRLGQARLVGRVEERHHRRLGQVGQAPQPPCFAEGRDAEALGPGLDTDP